MYVFLWVFECEYFCERVWVPVVVLVFELFVDVLVLGRGAGTYSSLRLKVMRSRICMSVSASRSLW
jgi:hypothetical protein